jgi:hypothetical protein
MTTNHGRITVLADSGHSPGNLARSYAGNRPTRGIPSLRCLHLDGQDRLAGERIYYDRATVMRQLGLFHEPEGAVGRLVIALSHPMTIAKAFLRRSNGARPDNVDAA